MTPEELLSQLKEIHEPAAIGVWPLAPGWWILIVCTTFIAIVTILLWRRHIQKNGWKKEAVNTIAAIKKQASEQSHHQSLFLINQLIKRVAIYKCNDTSIKALTGESWGQYLVDFLNGPDTPNMFSTQQLNLLSEGLYQQTIDTDKSINAEITALLKALNNWIKEA